MASLYVDIVSRLLPSLPSKPLPRSSRHLISPSSLLHLFLQPHLNKISWEFPYSINRSGHVQAPAPPAYSSSSPPLHRSLDHPLSAGNYMLLIHQLRISVHRFSAPLGAVTSYD